MNGGRWRKSGDMVQPGSGSAAEVGGGGGGGGGEEAGLVPAAAIGGGRGGGQGDAINPEVLQRVLQENRELKGALRRSSAALRQRCDELQRLQCQRRAEHDALRGRAAQARALVEALRRDRDQARRECKTPSAAPEVTPEVPLKLTPEVIPEPPSLRDSPPTPPRADTGSDGDPPHDPPATPQEQRSNAELQRRLAATEAELFAARQAAAAAELRAQEAAREAELQLQALRRQLEDRAQVKAQVTSLLGELQESQSRLESSRRERGDMERRAQAALERCRALEEAASSQSVQLDQLRMQVDNLETALRIERHGATEEKRKLVQLQVAYHQLFQEYDAHIKASMEGDKRSQGAARQLSELSAQLQQAEEALAAKQELIDKLKAEAEQHRAALETLPVLQAQADIFAADFAAERAAREQLHAQREALQAALSQLQRQLRSEAEGNARARMEEMRNRHSDLRPAAGSFGVPPPAPEVPDLCCPKCQYKAPDMDTLQIHVMECIK